MTTFIDIIVQGTLLGGQFALYALGLSLLFGVMRVVNIAHGDVIVLAAYCGLVIVDTLAINPFVALIGVLPIAVAAGYVLQRLLFVHVRRDDPLVPMLVAFGISIVIQNGLLMAFGADPQKLSAGPIEQASIPLIGDVRIGVFPLVIFLIAVALIAAVQFLTYRTAFGRLMRAVSDNEANAALIGIETQHVFRWSLAIVLGIVAIAAILMAAKSNFDPAAGSSRLLWAFEAIVIGGMGNFWGTLAGGVALGIAQMAGAAIDTSWQTLAGHLLFLIVLVVRPEGLFLRIKG